MNWIRARFKANFDDPRPVKWPPPGPFWVTGSAVTEDYATVVAYFKNENQFKEFWPEAEDIDYQRVDEIIFTDRFEKPDWWNSSDNDGYHK